MMWWCHTGDKKYENSVYTASFCWFSKITPDRLGLNAVGVGGFLVRMCVYCVKCTKFGKLFLRKVIKTVATRCLDYSSKHPKMRLAGRWGSLSAPPDPLAAKGGLLLRRGEGGDGREGRRGREGRDFAGPIKIWLLQPWYILVDISMCMLRILMVSTALPPAGEWK